MKLIQSMVHWLFAAFSSATGAALTLALQLGAVSLVLERRSIGEAYLVMLVSLMVAAPIFLAGAAVLGAPVASFMGKRQLSRSLPAAVTGATLSTTTGLALLWAMLGPSGLPLATALPLAGAVGGLIFREAWALRPRPRPPRARP